MVKDTSLADILKEGVWGEMNPNSIGSTVLSNGYIVSTTELKEFTKLLDSMIGLAMTVTGIEPEDLADGGFRGDLRSEGDFETMVFPCDAEGVVTDWQEMGFLRYMSREEAIEGHKEMVNKWRRMK